MNESASKNQTLELEAGDRLDGFRISRILARSGMGSVFEARQLSTGRAVVLKVPHLHFESDVVFFSRFQREERIGLRLNHPAIVKVIAYADRSRPYLAMEHVQGEPLRRLMDRTHGAARLPADRVLAIGRELCEALAYMHREGVVHRDLKPENILIDPNDGVHIVDFGIALDLTARRLTWGRLSARLGTPEYMSPEQIRGERGDARTDVYALGLILYELLGGEPPFVAERSVAVMKAKCGSDPRPLDEVAPDINPEIAAVVMRAIQRAPKDRYGTAAEMLAALQDPSRALASSTGDPVRNGSGEMPGRALAHAGVVCALLAALIGLVVLVR